VLLCELEYMCFPLGFMRSIRGVLNDEHFMVLK
jgi:hypothetical protein